MSSAVLQNPFAKQPVQQQQQTQPAGIDGKPIESTVIPPEDNIDAIDPKTGKKKVVGSDDPMMDFSKLWENPPVDPEHPEPTEPETFLPKIDPAK